MPCSLFKILFTCCHHRVKEECPRSEYESIQEELPGRETPIPDDLTPASSLNFSIKPPSSLSDEAAHRSWVGFDGVHITDEEVLSSSPNDQPLMETSALTAEYTHVVVDRPCEDITLSSGGLHHQVDEGAILMPTSHGAKDSISNLEISTPAIKPSKSSSDLATTNAPPRPTSPYSFYRNKEYEICGENPRHDWREVDRNSGILDGQPLPFLEHSGQSSRDESGAGYAPRPTIEKEITDAEFSLDTPCQEAPHFATPENNSKLKGPLEVMSEPDYRFLYELNQRLLEETEEIVQAPAEVSGLDNQNDDNRLAVPALDAWSSSEKSEASDSLSSDKVPAVLGGVPNPDYWGKRKVLQPPNWADNGIPKTPYREIINPDSPAKFGYSASSSFGTADVENIDKASEAFFASQSNWEEQEDDLAYHSPHAGFRSLDMWTSTERSIANNEFYHHTQDGEEILLECKPIPFNPLYERTSTRTPSVVSNGSEFDCESPLFEKSVAAMGREKYLKGPDRLPKSVIAAGLIGISKGETSLKTPRSKRRSLSVFQDQSPDTSALPPKPSTRGPLQDVTSHYYREVNVQSISDSEDGVAKSMGNDLDTDSDVQGVLQIDGETPVPLIDDQSTLSVWDTTTYFGSSPFISSSSPLTPPEPLLSQPAEDTLTNFMSSPIPYGPSKKVPPPLSERPGKAAVASALEAEAATKLETGVLSPAWLLSRSPLGQMVLKDMEDWKRRHRSVREVARKLDRRESGDLK